MHQRELELWWSSGFVLGLGPLAQSSPVQVIGNAAGPCDKSQDSHLSLAGWALKGVHPEGSRHEVLPLDAVLGSRSELATVSPEMKLPGCRLWWGFGSDESTSR